MLPLLVLLVWLPPALLLTVKIVQRRRHERTPAPPAPRPVVYARVPCAQIHVEQRATKQLIEDAATPAAQDQATHVGLILNTMLRPTFKGVLVPIQGFEQMPVRPDGIVPEETHPGYWTLNLN